jgi:20S proteasome subunit beta 1
MSMFEAKKEEKSSSSSSSDPFFNSHNGIMSLSSAQNLSSYPLAKSALHSVLKGSVLAPSTLLGIDPKTTGERMTGTSIMAVSYNGGVVMGADSRTSTGDYVSNRVTDKLAPVHDRIYCLRSGSAADTQAVSDIVEYYLQMHSLELNQLPKVKTAATLFADLIYQNKERLLAGVIVGGWDKKNGGSVFTITLAGSMHKQRYSIGGSGSTYIYAWCDANYKDGMTKDECQKFVKRGLSHAMARDGYSGGVIRMVTIDESGCKRDFFAGDRLDFHAERDIQ